VCGVIWKAVSTCESCAELNCLCEASGEARKSWSCRSWLGQKAVYSINYVLATMGGDLQPGRLADKPYMMQCKLYCIMLPFLPARSEAIPCNAGAA